MTDAASRNTVNINAFVLCHQLRRQVGLNIGPTCRVVGDEPALRILWRDGRAGGMRPLRQGAGPRVRSISCGSTPRLRHATTVAMHGEQACDLSIARPFDCLSALPWIAEQDQPGHNS
ncbi:MAG: hypothetical protein K9G72_21430 [Rhodobacteraceae bacterium]|nr:hypothetical protein [Paracoccaceae bacterium]MCF8521155.1 hypothetical protein [Paracoccaceae bacterium]